MLIGAQAGVFARGRMSIISLVRMSLDPVLIVCALFIALLITGHDFEGPEVVLSILVFSLTFPGEVSMRKIKQSLAVTIGINWMLVATLLVFFGYATKLIWYFDLRALLIWFAMTPVVLWAAHSLIPLVVPQLLAIDGYRSTVVVAANEVGRKLAATLRREPTLGFRFVGFFDDDHDGTELADEGALLGRLDEVIAYVKQHAIETVFIALPMAAQPRVLALVESLKDTTASIYFVPDIFMFDLIQARIDDLSGMPVLAVCETPITGVNAVAKRLTDIAVATIALVLLAPLMIVLALAVRATSPGPAIFRQRRYGLDGQQIIVWKFRSMTVAEDGAEIKQAQKNDQRVTRLGAFMRRTSLDELPQFINVLQGSMSVVGPRPHAVAHNEAYRKLIRGYMMRHKVKPGITGWAQINGLRGETETLDKMQQRIEYDIDYLRRWSVGFDLLIVIKTVLIVFRRTNAY